MIKNPSLVSGDTAHSGKQIWETSRKKAREEKTGEERTSGKRRGWKKNEWQEVRGASEGGREREGCWVDGRGLEN